MHYAVASECNGYAPGVRGRVSTNQFHMSSLALVIFSVDDRNISKDVRPVA